MTEDRPLYIADHEERAQADLVSRLRRPIIRAIVGAFAREVQQLEDAGVMCIQERLLSNATGKQLDVWGEVLGERRGGLDDSEFRRFLFVRIIANRGAATAPKMITVATLLAEPVAEATRYTPRYPACYTLQMVPINPWSREGKARVVKMLGDIAPSGVGWVAIQARPGAFGFSDDPDARGYDDDGILSEVLGGDY